ncbi:hypothetical protein CsatB_001368 [Cannabis sativa]
MYNHHQQLAVQIRWTPGEIQGARATRLDQMKVRELSFPQMFGAEVEVPGAGHAVGVMLTRHRLPRLPKLLRMPIIGKTGLQKMQTRINEQEVVIRQLRQQGAPAVPVLEIPMAPAPAVQAEPVVGTKRMEPLYERFRKQAPPVFLRGPDVMKAEQWLLGFYALNKTDYNLI